LLASIKGRRYSKFGTPAPKGPQHFLTPRLAFVRVKDNFQRRQRVEAGDWFKTFKTKRTD
jgi:hypothetical protein